MARGINKVILVGNLGADPEVRSFQNGGKVCNLRIATSESWKDRNTGERQERTEWHTVAIFSEGLAGVAERFLRKGSKVYLAYLRDPWNSMHEYFADMDYISADAGWEAKDWVEVGTRSIWGESEPLDFPKNFETPELEG